jgi:uncharacterized protein (DUF427 family)
MLHMMGLTMGSGPFGPQPKGRFDFDPPARIRYVEDFPRRVRAERDGVTVIDSERVKLVWVTGNLPQYAFPAEDVNVRAHAVKGLDGYVALAWNAVDAWFEEEERVYVHVRDPYSRIDVVVEPTRNVRAAVDGETLAEGKPRILYETGLPPRYYFDPADVRLDLLTPTDTETGCAYKGTARYWSYGEHKDVAWAYQQPHWDGERVRGRIAFFNERVDLEVDGVAQEKPKTEWSE